MGIEFTQLCMVEGRKAVTFWKFDTHRPFVVDSAKGGVGRRSHCVATRYSGPQLGSPMFA
jgi:hypothetical protein